MSSDYRLAPGIGARLLGSALVGLAVLVFVVTLMAALLDLSAWFVGVVAALGLLGVLVAGYLVTRRGYVVRLEDDGYRVRLVRGAGVRTARWSEVEDAVAATPRGVPCLVLRLRDGRTTTIPVQVLAADRDEFARDVQAHLERSVGGTATGPT
ncbi:hypothetical protein [Nocardioides sp.]|uniref:hypothetical protein n=1 Tax=Nocardioides sp. TaxID=35761 RepID=UPI002D7F0194|nr:hypothetical protein [Nocardioides sp.]HET8961930.1 hypothetical protein [Nocardioides sp.]